jgi:hypothetical protein
MTDSFGIVAERCPHSVRSEPKYYPNHFSCEGVDHATRRHWSAGSDVACRGSGIDQSAFHLETHADFLRASRAARLTNEHD